MGPLVLLLPTPPVPSPTVAELPGPPLVAESLALLPVAMAGVLLLVLAAADPSVMSPVAVPGASLLLHFPLIVAVEPLLLLPVAGPGVSRVGCLLCFDSCFSSCGSLRGFLRCGIHFLTSY